MKTNVDEHKKVDVTRFSSRARRPTRRPVSPPSDGREPKNGCYTIFRPSQAARRAVSPPSVQSGNQPTNQLANQPSNQVARQPARQPTNQLANQPSNQPARQPANEPATHTMWRKTGVDENECGRKPKKRCYTIVWPIQAASHPASHPAKRPVSQPAASQTASQPIG